jgi:hypothetical protein
VQKSLAWIFARHSDKIGNRDRQAAGNYMEKHPSKWGCDSTDSSTKFRASWFSENSDRGIALSVSILLSSGFSDALFVCFW